VAISDFVDLISKGGVITLLVIVVLGFYNEQWVSGKTYQRALKERDQYREELFITIKVAERATMVTERTVDIAGTQLGEERKRRIQDSGHGG
jgi:hypothetical protein